MRKGGCQLYISWQDWHRGSPSSSGASVGASLYTSNDRGKRRAKYFIQFRLCYCTVYRVVIVGAGKEESSNIFAIQLENAAGNTIGLFNPNSAR